MKNNLVLIDDKGKYVVECLNDEFEFVHNTVDLSNWFNQKTLAKIFGVSQVNISSRLKRYLDNLKKSNSSITKSYKASSNGYIKLKTNQTTQKVLFYDFKAVTYLAHRINTPEAFDMLEWIDSSLNTMFNVVTGKTELDTQMDKLKNMYEVEEYKANVYLKAHNELVKVDKQRANELYHLHKVHYHNALNCYDLLVSKDDWKNRFDTVVRQIDGKIDNTKQLTF